MKRLTLLLVCVVLVFAVSAIVSSDPGQAQGRGRGVPKVLEFDVMIGVPRPYTGGDNAIRGIGGGGLPWVISEGEGELRVNGDIEVKVEGLVLDPLDPGVPDSLAGINPVPFFKAVVSCLSIDEDGNPIVVNVDTGLFEADEEGNAVIEDNVALPDPCIAPIIFVTSPGGSWFASTGF